MNEKRKKEIVKCENEDSCGEQFVSTENNTYRIVQSFKKKDLNELNSDVELMSEQEKDKFYGEILLYFDENRSNLKEILTNIKSNKKKFDSTINTLFERCKIEKDQYKAQQAKIILFTLIYAIFFTFNLNTFIRNLVQHTKKDVDYVSKVVKDTINWFYNTMGIDLKNFSLDSLKNLKIDVLINKNGSNIPIMNLEEEGDRKKKIPIGCTEDNNNQCIEPKPLKTITRTFVTNNQPKKEQKKSVLTITKFLDEELEFLKEENISIKDSDSKWSWLTSELAEKYFISVLLPYYIVNPNINYKILERSLGFRSFFRRLQFQNIRYSDIKKNI